MIPRLLHPTTVTILRLDKDNTVYDHNSREPIGRSVRKTSVTIPGQVSWRGSQLKSEIYGQTLKTDGYILFRRKDLEDETLTITLEDKITQIGSGDAAVSVSLFIVGIDYRAHYPDQGGYTLVKCWFADKKPSR